MPAVGTAICIRPYAGCCPHSTTSGCGEDQALAVPKCGKLNRVDCITLTDKSEGTRCITGFTVLNIGFLPANFLDPVHIDRE